MARRARVEYAGALYHVITRGNQRQRIFRDDLDRTKYLEILANLKTQYSFRIPAYVLMVNHVHLLLESGAVPLGARPVSASKSSKGQSGERPCGL